MLPQTNTLIKGHWRKLSSEVIAFLCRFRIAFALAMREMLSSLRRGMPRKRKVAGGLLAVLGFILLPLSWWNEAFVNLPLALASA